MPTSKRQGHKVLKSVRTEDASGLRIDAGPFVGIVKHVLDPTRSGRLQVYLPHLGGDPENPNNQKIVQYASPFAGYTNFQLDPKRDPNTKLEFETVRHHYGMWFTPPDVGVRVLVIFEAGNPNNGYWIACLPPVYEHNQTGSSGGVTADKLASDAQVDDLISGYNAQYAPALDVNGAALTSITNQNIIDGLKPPHRIQTKILAEQGLLADPARGIDNASTIRETPSGAFGITTPGRTYIDQATDDYLQQVAANVQVDPSKLRERIDDGRKGGHQLIMDDGDVNGNQRRMKFRTAAGHQIVMDDTSGMVYISTSTGKNWIELTNDGQMYIYSEGDVTMRTGGNYNLKVDGDFNTEVNGNYNLKVRGDVKTEAVNREEVLTGNKDVDISGRYDTNVTGNIDINTDAKFSMHAGGALALESGANFGMISGGEMAFDSTGKCGWKAADNMDFEAPQIGLNTTTPPSPEGIVEPTVPAPFTLADLNDTVKNGNIWQHAAPSASTQQTILPKITTHEPYDSRDVALFVSATGQPSKRI